MSDPKTDLDAVLAAIDAANETDPRQELVDGENRPREIVYSERMTECLSDLYPNASEELKIAARGQHICRWQIARSDYPEGRAGYNAWRIACRNLHATLLADIMRTAGYSDTSIEQVAKIVKKQGLKQDPESQALENVVGVVFVRYYMEPFIDDHGDYDDAKHADILKKTMKKMDAHGHAAVLKLPLSDRIKRIVELASA